MFGDIYTSNVQTDFYIPYLGVRAYPLEKTRFRLTFLYSPIAYADLTQKFFYKTVLSPSLSSYEWENISMNSFGNFLEAGIEYDWPVFHGIALGLWIKGDYLAFNGRGNEGYTLNLPGIRSLTATAHGGGGLEASGISGGATISF